MAVDKILCWTINQFLFWAPTAPDAETEIVLDHEETNFGRPLMQIAKSLVMKPASMVSMHTASNASENTRSSALLSSFARWSRPRVQAKMEADKHINSALTHTQYVTDYVCNWNKYCFLGDLCLFYSLSCTYGIGGGLFSLLVLSVMASHCAVGSFRLHCASIRTDQHTSHHTQGAVAWNRVTQNHINNRKSLNYWWIYFLLEKCSFARDKSLGIVLHIL